MHSFRLRRGRVPLVLATLSWPCTLFAQPASPDEASPNASAAETATPAPAATESVPASAPPVEAAPPGGEGTSEQAPALYEREEQALPPPEPTYPSAIPRSASPFDQGSLRLGIRAGWASTTAQTWVLLGAGFGYFALDGLEALVDADVWIGDPALVILTPGLRYVFHMVPDIKPYVGPLYRHYFVTDGGLDSDSIGARAGVYFMASPTIYIGGGILYEHMLDQNLFLTKDAVYPELSIGFAF